jgi:cytochrome c5
MRNSSRALRLAAMTCDEHVVRTRAMRRSAALVLLCAGVVSCGRSRAPAASLPAAGAESSATVMLSEQIAEQERTSIAALPQAPGRELVLTYCITCHSASMLVQQRKDSAGWARTMTQMVNWGVAVPEERRAELLAYLRGGFGTAPRNP